MVVTNEERNKSYNEASLSLDMDLETKEWIGEEDEKSSSQDEILEGREHTKDF